MIKHTFTVVFNRASSPCGRAVIQSLVANQTCFSVASFSELQDGFQKECGLTL